eukprot:755574-Hanusia_phi.AAC.1
MQEVLRDKEEAAAHVASWKSGTTTTALSFFEIPKLRTKLSPCSLTQLTVMPPHSAAERLSG